MTQKAQFIIYNANVFTAGQSAAKVEAAAILGNRILRIGSNEDCLALQGPGTRVIDAGGRTLMPGFIDSHFHMVYGALNMDGMQLEPVTNYQDLSRVITEYAAKHPDDPWLPGTGLRYINGPDHAPLNRHHLDALVSDRPIYLNAYDGHTSWANTLALKMAGIFQGGECGPNSLLVMGDDGFANGEMREPGAYQPVSDLVPKPGEAQKRDLLRQALKLTASLGVTSVHNMDGDLEKADMFADFEKQGELTCRIYLPYSVSPETPLSALKDEALNLNNIFTPGILRTGCIKFFLDGVIESYTGLLVEPYDDDPSTNGAANYSIEHYNRMFVEADRLGLQIFTHAVGDLAVRRILDAAQEAIRINGKRDSRHRIEHIELVHPADVPRFKELGVIASMQPLHAPGKVDDADVWPTRVGKQRWGQSFAWNHMRDAGARLVFGSDWPVVNHNPIQGTSHAVNRNAWLPGLPDHRQGLVETLHSYTSDAAFAEFQENEKGQVKEGFLADLVLLSKNIFDIPVEELAEVKVDLTMMNGNLVYEA